LGQIILVNLFTTLKLHFFSIIGKENEVFTATIWMVISFIMQEHEQFIFIVFLASIMAVTLWLFLGYHIYLIYCGTTTNEKFRKSDHIAFCEKEIISLHDAL